MSEATEITAGSTTPPARTLPPKVWWVLRLLRTLVNWYMRRKTRKRWHCLSPEEQMGVWIETLASNQKLRQAFRRALRVNGHSA